MTDGGEFFRHIVELDKINLSKPQADDIFWIMDNNGIYFEAELYVLPWIKISKTYTPQEVIEKIWKIYENRHNS